ncbi:MAG: CHAT domain-containing protein [Candidatus Aminicenantes bacterium]|jgi:tetratricopeptide (TPR) repeat protein
MKKSLKGASAFSLFVCVFFGFASFVFPFSKNPPSTALTEKDTIPALLQKGKNSRSIGDFEQAIQYFEKVRNFAQRSADSQQLVAALTQLGVLYWNIGRLDTSFSFYKKALFQAGKGKPEAQRNIRTALDIYRLYKDGKTKRYQKQNQRSIACFEEAIALAEEIGSLEHQVKCLRQLGVTYWEMDNNKKFYKASIKALEIARTIHHRTEEARCAYNVGLCFSHRNEYSRALKHYEDALRIFRETKNIDEESFCLTNISDVYIQLGDYEKALENLTAVLSIDRKLKEDQYVAMDLNNIGVIYRKKGLLSGQTEDLQRALSAFQESLQISRRIDDGKTEVQCLNNMGTVYTDLGEYSGASHHLKLGLEKAERLRDMEEAAAILVNMGTVYSKEGRLDLSVETLHKAIKLAHQIEDESILWEAYARSGDAFKKLEDYNLALEEYTKSIEIIESLRSKIRLEELKASYLGSNERINAYSNLIDLFYRMSQENPEQEFVSHALHYMEKAKARSFLDRLELSQMETWMDVNPALLEKEDGLMTAISNVNSRLIQPGIGPRKKKELIEQMEGLEQELEVLKRKIRLSSPSYADLKYPRIISPKEAQVSLTDADTALFVYCIGEETSYCIALTREALKMFPLPPAPTLRFMVKNYIQAITDKDNHDFRPGYRLYSVLVYPGLSFGLERLIVIPDDILHFLPYETLITKKEEQRWLIEDYSVSYSPSITSLQEIQLRDQKRKKNQKKDLLSFGNPHLGRYEGRDGSTALLTRHDTRDNFHLSRLEYSKTEVEKIASLFRTIKKDVYTGEKATEARLKNTDLTSYKIIHFATHGLIDNRSPARSSLVLSLKDQSSEDGFLQMREVFNLKLNAGLVALSACQTGLGQLIKGEGVEGISRAFLFAGASSVLMSLWAVNDQASYHFMHRFYTHLRSCQTVVDALRTSKLELIHSETLSHPFYWAGFIISGRGGKALFSYSQKKLVVSAVFLAFVLSLLFIKPLKKIRSLLSSV